MNWHTRFRPGLDLEQTAVRRVEFKGVDQFETGDGFDVVETALPAGTDSVRSYALVQRVLGLSQTQVARSIQFEGPRCANDVAPTVRGVGSIGIASAALQLLTCPRSEAPGFDVVGVVPVLVPDIDAIGVRVDDVSERTVDGAPGFAFAIGGVASTLSFPDPSYATFRIGSGDTHGLNVGSIDRVRIGSSGGPDLDETFIDAGGRVSLSLSRRWAGQAAGRSAIYVPRFAVLTLDDDRYVAGALDAIVYENTHHNWYDSFEAVSGDVEFSWRVSTELEGECDGDFQCWFVTVRRGAEVLLEETRVTLEQE